MNTYIPQRMVRTYTIAASGSISDVLVPDFEIANVNVTSGADITVSLNFAGKDYSGSFSVVADFGRFCKGEIELSATNSGSTDESLTIEVLGVKQISR